MPLLSEDNKRSYIPVNWVHGEHLLIARPPHTTPPWFRTPLPSTTRSSFSFLFLQKLLHLLVSCHEAFFFSVFNISRSKRGVVTTLKQMVTVSVTVLRLGVQHCRWVIILNTKGSQGVLWTRGRSIHHVKNEIAARMLELHYYQKAQVHRTSPVFQWTFCWSNGWIKRQRLANSDWCGKAEYLRRKTKPRC